MVEWFRRQSEKIKTLDKKDTAEGLWIKCPQCREVVYRKMLEENCYMCTICAHHFRITSGDYIKLLIVLSLKLELNQNYLRFLKVK